MKCQSYSFFRGSDYLRIEAIPLAAIPSNQQNTDDTGLKGVH